MSLRSSIRSLFRRNDLDSEMNEEMRLHLELQTERNIAAGMAADEARFAARKQFGGVEQIKERCRDQRGLVWLENFGRDLRFAARSLRRAPGFCAAMIATIALCLGPNVAILTMIYALVLKPQPFREPGQLVQVFNVFDKVGGGRSRQMSSPPQYRDFKAHADLFEGFAMMRYAGSTIGEETMPERATGMRVDAGFFPLLGVQPLLGRFGSVEEDAVGRDHVLVLTESFWRSHYQADPGVIGRVIRMGSEPWTVIGVAPRSVETLDPYTMFFKPYEPLNKEEDAMARYTGKVAVFARLKAGVSEAAARAQLAAIDARFVTDQATPSMRAQLEAAGQRVVFERLGESLAGSIRFPLTLLQAGALFVLLIGAVNVLNLTLARTNAKRGELAIRFALGAGRATLLRQLLTESLLLTTVASALGLALAWASLRLTSQYLPIAAAKAMPVGLEPPVVAAIAVVAALLALVLGAIPFALVWRSGLRLGETRTASAGAGARWCSSGLVMAQVAIALVLLVGAGLLIRSFARVMAVDPGFDAAQVVQGRVALPHAYDAPEKNVAMQRRMLAAMREIPGVEHAALITDYAIGGSFRSVPFVIRGAAVDPGENKPLVFLNQVSSEYFETMGIRLLEGRFFTEADDPRSGPVAIVDDLFVQRYFPGRSAVGQEINFGTRPPPDGAGWPRIVGVVRRAQLAGQEGRDGLPFIYVPLVQQPGGGVQFIVRSPRAAADVLAAMRQKLREIDSTVPLYSADSLQAGLDSMLMFRRGMMQLIAAFAALALVLAAVGLYGVLAYDVSQRTREIGIRGAIGASRGQIVMLVLRQGLWKTGVGLAVGAAGAVYLTRFIRNLLFEVGPLDPVAFVSVSVLMLGVALLASWLPARRAAKVDPIVALRCE